MQKKELQKAMNGIVRNVSWQLRNKKFPIGFPDPVEAIKFRMEHLGYTQTDLANVVGLKSRASGILSGKENFHLIW